MSFGPMRRRNGTGRAARVRLWPRRDYYQELVPADGRAHPVDEMVDASDEVHRWTKRVRRLRDRVVGRAPAPRWVAYADAAFALSTLREALAFNVGVEYGALAARAEVLPGRSRRTAGPIERRLRKQLLDLVFGAGIPAQRRVVVLSDLAGAVAAGAPERDRVAPRRSPARLPQNRRPG